MKGLCCRCGQLVPVNELPLPSGDGELFYGAEVDLYELTSHTYRIMHWGTPISAPRACNGSRGTPMELVETTTGRVIA